MIDIVLGLAIAFCVGLAIREVIKKKKTSKQGGCDGNCAGCAHRTSTCNVVFLGDREEEK